MLGASIQPRKIYQKFHLVKLTMLNSFFKKRKSPPAGASMFKDRKKEGLIDFLSFLEKKIAAGRSFNVYRPQKGRTH